MQTVKTDILIIGGGVAGLAAAIEAKNKGNTVTIACKSLAGKSGNTIVTGSAMALARTGNNGDSPELLYEDVMKSSQGINDEGMAEYFAIHSGNVLEKLSDYGVIFKKSGDEYVTKRAPGHSVFRSFPVDISKVPYNARGLSISLPLLKSVIQKDINIVNNTMVYKLLKRDGRVCGALAVNKKDNKQIQFITKVIIIAAGGGANIFSKTNNTGDITGDSYTLALNAGAELRDMEFVQYYPTMMFKPLKICVSNPLFGEGAFLRNARNERFMERYSAEGDMATRDAMALAIYREIKAGRGNPDYIYVDCSQIPLDVIEGKFSEFKRLLLKGNINIYEDRMSVTPAAHFYLGGIKVYNGCETKVSGLLACGEAVAGVHGANRLSGNSLTETVVFGSLAGRRAAEMARKTDNFLDLGQDKEDNRVLTENRSNQASEIKKKLRELMWDNAAVARNEFGLKYARERLKELGEQIENCAIKNLRDYIKYEEVKNLLQVSQLVVEGALLRRESRGAHYREDYPEKNEKFKGNFIYNMRKEKVEIEFEHK